MVQAHGHARQISSKAEGGFHEQFIPARTGNTKWYELGFSNSYGSSTRMRRTRHRAQAGAPARRFIPARAGNARFRNPVRSASPVHPCAGGERDTGTCSYRLFGGSSPRGRGTRLGRLHHSAEHRFIPARAGNAKCCRGCSSTPAVHPRARGEHCRCRRLGLQRNGSSPRTRGTPIASDAETGQARFIPAHAGNTRSWPARR